MARGVALGGTALLAFVCALMQRLSCLFTHKFAANATHTNCGRYSGYICSQIQIHTRTHRYSHTDTVWHTILDKLLAPCMMANALYILHTLIQFNGRINLAHLLHFKIHTHEDTHTRTGTPSTSQWVNRSRGLRRGRVKNICQLQIKLNATRAAAAATKY